MLLIRFFSTILSRSGCCVRALTGKGSAPLRVKMIPGNIYLFWGYRSIHANEPCDADKDRGDSSFPLCKSPSEVEGNPQLLACSSLFIEDDGKDFYPRRRADCRRLCTPPGAGLILLRSPARRRRKAFPGQLHPDNAPAAAHRQ